MRFFFSGPRILGIRPGVIFGASDFRSSPRPTQRPPGEPITGSFLYVIRGDHNLVKIGVTTNPQARLASLRTGSAFPIDYSYIAVTPGTGFDIEAGSHEMLKSHRCSGEWFDIAPEMAVAAIAGAAHKLGQPILPVTAEVADQILAIAANGSGPPSNNTYLFDGLPWWLRLPLQMVSGTVCGVVIFVAFALLYLIATSPR
jgi:Meiotically Up-regulated Gene 113 (MUG113) protein